MHCEDDILIFIYMDNWNIMWIIKRTSYYNNQLIYYIHVVKDQLTVTNKRTCHPLTLYVTAYHVDI